MNYLAFSFFGAVGRPRAGARVAGRHGPRRLAAALFVLGAVALAACQFQPGQLTPTDGGGGEQPDADPDAPDADVTPIDANPAAPDAAVCAWTPFAPTYVDPCAAGKPNPAVDLILDDGGSYIYDTTTGGFVDFTPPAGVVTTDENGAHTLWVRNFLLGDSVTLRVRGNRPLMIVASEELRVRGTLDASSTWNTVTESYDRGPGLEPLECTTAAAEIGGSCNEGSGGGGGGGFGGAGGLGGDGGGNRNCSGVFGVPGGAGGANVDVPATLRAGCDGKRGGNGEVDGLYGIGAAAGGAVHLVARMRLRVDGTIHAGGAGGAPGKDKRSGGGGGGSGGFIGLESSDIQIESGALLAANGGGGGGGTNGPGGGTSGTDGLAGELAAEGGGGQSNGTGGTGSDIDTFNGGPGGNGDRGGGGGGGGAGYIVFYQDQPVVDGESVISPAPTQR